MRRKCIFLVAGFNQFLDTRQQRHVKNKLRKSQDIIGIFKFALAKMLAADMDQYYHSFGVMFLSVIQMRVKYTSYLVPFWSSPAPEEKNLAS